MQLLNPLTVQNIRLASPDILDVVGVDQIDPKAAGFQDLVDGTPVDAGGLHGDGLNLACSQPVGQRVQIGGEGREDSHRLDIAIFGDAGVDLFRADIQARGVQVELL